MSTKIASLQNPLVKRLIKLQDKARERKKTGLFTIEGLRELSLAIAGDYRVKSILYVPEIVELDQLSKIATSPLINFFEISKEVYKKLAYREGTEGMIAVIKAKNHHLEQIKINNKNPLVLIVEAPEKPGNIGALLRTADAANVDAVFIANPTTDLYNSNIIRSSVGCVFTNQIAMGSSSEIRSYLKEKNIRIFCATLKEKSKAYHTQDFTKATAIVVGTEATGLSEEWYQDDSQSIIIPMRGEIDSINVSVAAGILVFEAVRQRFASN